MPISDRIVEDAVEIVRQAAFAEIMPRFRALAESDVRAKTSAQDLVTEADISAEAFLVGNLSRLLPEAVFIGEESGLSEAAMRGRLESDLCIVIDPVDGTFNYVNGLEVFGTIVAMVQRGEVVMGLLYDPVLDDWILAVRGGGAFLCGRKPGPEKLAVPGAEAGDCRDPEGMSGFLTLHHFPVDRRRRLAAALPDLNRIASLGCSCHEYRQLLMGQWDFKFDTNINVWDHAAGVLALREAGGRSGFLSGGLYEPAVFEGRLLTAVSESKWSDLAGRFP